MTILYDDRAFRQRFGGVPKCFCEVMRRFPHDVHWRIAAQAVENEFLHEREFGVPRWPAIFMDEWRGIGWRYVKWRHERNDRIFADRVCTKDVDVVHLTEPHFYNGCWKVVPGDKPLVVTIHDLIPELINHDETVRRERAEVLARANKVIAVSQYTKRRLQELYGTPDEKIKVVYHGYAPMENQDLSPVFPGLKYLLYVGGRYAYKNFPWMVKALVPVLKDNPELKLVCTGVPFSFKEVAYLSELGIADKVIQKPIPDRQMQSLYAHAQCFIYPSKMEGFGIPILDAFAAKCPVVLSNCSCFPEVGGDAALYFEEGDENGLRAQVGKLMTDVSLRQQMIDRGALRATQFTWDRAASEVVSVYREVIDK